MSSPTGPQIPNVQMVISCRPVSMPTETFVASLKQVGIAAANLGIRASRIGHMYIIIRRVRDVRRDEEPHGTAACRQLQVDGGIPCGRSPLGLGLCEAERGGERNSHHAWPFSWLLLVGRLIRRRHLTAQSLERLHGLTVGRAEPCRRRICGGARMIGTSDRCGLTKWLNPRRGQSAVVRLNRF